MKKSFDRETLIANLKKAISLLEEGGTRFEVSNLLVESMGDGVCDLYCISTNAIIFQTIFDLLPVPVYYKDIMGVYMGCNQALASLYNRSKEEIIGHTVFEIFDEEDATLFTSSDMVLMNETSHEMVEHKGRFSAFGGQFHAIHKKVIFTSAGNVAGVLGIIYDLTEQKENEEKAWQGEAFYKSLFEESARALVIFDSFNMIEDMNIAALKLFGQDVSLIGMDISSLFESYEDFDKMMQAGDRMVRVKLNGVKGKALAGITVSSVASPPRYAASFIVTDDIL